MAIGGPDAFVGGGLLATVFGLVAGGTFLGMRKGALDNWASSIHKRKSFAAQQYRSWERQQHRQRQRKHGVQFGTAGFGGPDFASSARGATGADEWGDRQSTERAEARRTAEARRAKERLAHEARRNARDVERRQLYEVLGIKPPVTRGQLKAAYLRAAKRCHPDTNPSDPTAASKFLLVQRAWQTLSQDA